MIYLYYFKIYNNTKFMTCQNKREIEINERNMKDKFFEYFII